MYFLTRSILFIPAASKKMLEKINVLRPDIFMIDLEDCVPENQKDTARNNIIKKFESIDQKELKIPIFIRINDLDSKYFKDDIKKIVSGKLSGVMIPKFESHAKLEKLEEYLDKIEKDNKLDIGKIKVILQIESSKGIKELSTLEEGFSNRVIGIAFGSEDYLGSMKSYREVTRDMLDFARKSILLYSKSLKLLTIDTIYKNFKDLEGLKKETSKIAQYGFDGKLAIHPNQIEIINSSFMPSEEEIKAVKEILKYKKKIENKGAISIDGNMLDIAHLRWAVKIDRILKEAD